jgi:ABC-type maltose transport system permease subunit
MSVLSMLPCILVFFVAQKRFVEGITWSGLKA